MISSAYVYLMDSDTDIALRDLELRHLEALRAVSVEGTFGRAAKRLGYSQSAISQQIAALERVVGEKMFDRPGGPKPVRLTAAGRMLLGHAEEVLERVARLARNVGEYKAGTSGRIDLGVFQSVAVKVVPIVVRRLRETAQGVDVRLFESRSDSELVAKVANHELDLTFTVRAPSQPGLEVEDLVSDPFVAIVPRDHQFGDTVTPFELGESPLIGQPVEDSCQRQIDAGMTAAGVRPEYFFRTTDNAAMQSMVRAGMGVAIVPYLAVDTNDHEIRICTLDPPLPARELKLVIGTDPSPVTRQFVELTVKYCREALSSAPV
jgi:DNA-binding transcriptional LysR family regulator